jgi:hypothetical protein
MRGETISKNKPVIGFHNVLLVRGWEIDVCCLCPDDAQLASQAMPNFHVGHRLTLAPTPTGFAEIVSDDFPILHTILPLAGPTY